MGDESPDGCFRRSFRSPSFVDPMTAESPSPAPHLLLTNDLLREAKRGNAAALDALMSRYLPRLHRWACGRLPVHARSLLDTSDLVQETMLKTLQLIDQIEIRGPG